MTSEVGYNEYSKDALSQIEKGAFMTTAYEGKVNTMTIGWGYIGFSWGKPIFTAMVRGSRFTHELLEKNGEFTISIPINEDVKKALGICGTKSGRDTDKFALANLTVEPGQKVSVPVVGECSLHFECRTVYKQDMIPEMLDGELDKSCYPEGDYHTYYMGEILTCYKTK